MVRDQQVRRLSSEVSKYDRRLFATRGVDGMIRVLRKGDRLEASDFNQSEPDLVDLHPQLILSLTHNWHYSGTPVEWGVEPVLEKLRAMDSWVDPAMFSRMHKARDSEKEREDRSRRNEFRSIALDLRKDFARATNDINTSGMKDARLGE